MQDMNIFTNKPFDHVFKYQSILKLTDIKVGDKYSLELLRFLEKG